MALCLHETVVISYRIGLLFAEDHTDLIRVMPFWSVNGAPIPYEMKTGSRKKGPNGAFETLTHGLSRSGTLHHERK